MFSRLLDGEDHEQCLMDLFQNSDDGMSLVGIVEPTEIENLLSRPTCFEALRIEQLRHLLFKQLVEWSAEYGFSREGPEYFELVTGMLATFPLESFSMNNDQELLDTIDKILECEGEIPNLSKTKFLFLLYNQRRQLPISEATSRWLGIRIYEACEEIRAYCEGRKSVSYSMSVEPYLRPHLELVKNLRGFGSASHSLPMGDDKLMIQLVGALDLSTYDLGSHEMYALEYLNSVVGALFYNPTFWLELLNTSNPWFKDKFLIIEPRMWYKFGDRLRADSKIGSRFSFLIRVTSITARLQLRDGNLMQVRACLKQLEALQNSMNAVEHIRYVQLGLDLLKFPEFLPDLSVRAIYSIDGPLFFFERAKLVSQVMARSTDFSEFPAVFNLKTLIASDIFKPSDPIPSDPLEIEGLVAHLGVLKSIYTKYCWNVMAQCSLPAHFVSCVETIVDRQVELCDNEYNKGTTDDPPLALSKIGGPDKSNEVILLFLEVFHLAHRSSRSALVDQMFGVLLKMAEGFAWPFTPSKLYYQQFGPTLAAFMGELPVKRVLELKETLSIDSICSLLERSEFARNWTWVLEVLENYLLVTPPQDLDNDPSNGLVVANLTEVVVQLKNWADSVPFGQPWPDQIAKGLLLVVRCLIAARRSRIICRFALNLPPLMISLRIVLSSLSARTHDFTVRKVVGSTIILLLFWCRMPTLGSIEKLRDFDFGTVLQEGDTLAVLGNDQPAIDALKKLRAVICATTETQTPSPDVTINEQ